MENTRDKILEVVVELLLRKEDVSTYSNRKIAELSGVNSALINYHFQSRENLLITAVGSCMEGIFAKKIRSLDDQSCPINALKNMVKGIAEVSFEYYHLSEILIKHEVANGSTNTIEMILPLLRRIYQGDKNESQIRLLALQIIVPFQSIFLGAKAYSKILGYDLTLSNARNEIIDHMIDNLIGLSSYNKA